MSNKSYGLLMVWFSGFFVAVNLTELLPHVGGMGAEWSKVVIGLALGMLGYFWCQKT